MAELFEITKAWFYGLGAQYGVDPIVFGSIYVGAIPFFTLSIAWLVKNHRNKKPVILPALSATFFFISAYLYLIVVGQNVPWWVYIIVMLMVTYGAYSTIKKVSSRIEETKLKK